MLEFTQLVKLVEDSLVEFSISQKNYLKWCSQFCEHDSKRSSGTTRFLIHFANTHVQGRRERLKSTLNLRLKKRKTFFWKKLEIFEFLSFEKCRIVPKNVKGRILLNLLTFILLQNIKKLERGTLWGH